MQHILPIYVAVDTSSSMATSQRLDAVQEAIIQLADELLSSPALGDQVRVGMLAFAEHAELVLPLTDLTELQSLPRLSARGGTRYGPLFRLLAKVIERDVLVLRAHETVISRPFVFLITDGIPFDPDWEHAFQEFDSRTRAKIVIIGISMDPDSMESLQRLRPVAMYAWDDVHDVLATRIFQVLDDFAKSLVRSVTISERRDVGQLQMPAPHPPLRETDIR